MLSISEGWVKTIKNSIAQIAPHYTMKRQLDDYYSKFYCKLAKRFQTLAANDNAKAKEIAAWKEDVVAKWDSIEIVSCDKVEELKNGDIESGKEYTITYVIDEKGLNDAVGLELVTTYTTADGKQHVYSVEPFSESRKKATCIHSRLNTACQMQVVSRCLTVCSRRIRNFHTVRTSATYVGLSNCLSKSRGVYLPHFHTYIQPLYSLRMTGAEFFICLESEA